MASSKDDVDQPTDSYSLLKNPYKDLDDGRQRFLLELEFVQCLANPTYIHYDEYATASENDPKILLTTSRELSQHLGQFVKELKLVFPNVARMNRGSQLGQRTANILKHLFPVPKPETKRIITFANKSDYISFRHHVYEKHGGPKSVELKEVGPRFELRLYQIILGTVDQQNEAQKEWVLRPYMNTAKKQNVLGA